jgi:hypothetical protein
VPWLYHGLREPAHITLLELATVRMSLEEFGSFVGLRRGEVIRLWTGKQVRMYVIDNGVTLARVDGRVAAPQADLERIGFPGGRQIPAVGPQPVRRPTVETPQNMGLVPGLGFFRLVRIPARARSHPAARGAGFNSDKLDPRLPGPESFSSGSSGWASDCLLRGLRPPGWAPGCTARPGWAAGWAASCEQSLTCSDIIREPLFIRVLW